MSQRTRNVSTVVTTCYRRGSGRRARLECPFPRMLSTGAHPLGEARQARRVDVKRPNLVESSIGAARTTPALGDRRPHL
jgi:hypothetical protein